MALALLWRSTIREIDPDPAVRAAMESRTAEEVDGHSLIPSPAQVERESAQVDPGSAAPRESALIVQVLDVKTEEPLPGVELQLNSVADGSPYSESFRTGAEGMAALAWSGPSRAARLTAEATTTHLAASLLVELLHSEDSQAEPVRVFLHPRQVSSFKVIERDGTPIAGLEVRSPFPDGMFKSGVEVPVLPPGKPIAYSDDEGRFVIADASGAGSLHFRFPSGSVAMASVTLGRAQEQIIRFPAFGAVRVVVTDRLGAPIAGAAIHYGYERVNNGGAPYVRVMEKRGLSDASGIMTLDRVDAKGLGLHRVRVEKEGFRPWEDCLPATSSVLNVVLDQGIQVRARIRSEAGGELDHVELLAWSPDAYNDSVPPSNRAGWVIGERVEPAVYTFAINSKYRTAAIRVAASGHAIRCLWPERFDPENPEISIVLEKECLVTARLDPSFDWGDSRFILVVLESSKIRGVGTTVPGAHDAQPVPFLDETEYVLHPEVEPTLRGLRARTYRYQLREPQSGAVLQEGTFFAGDPVVNIPGVSQGGERVAVSGTVVRGLSGMPFSSVSVRALPCLSHAGATTTVTDGHGQWRLDGIQSAPHWVVFSHAGFATRSVLVNPTRDSRGGALRVELWPEVISTVRFRRSEGHFGGDYYVSVEYLNGDFCPQPPLPSSAGGMPSRAWIDLDGYCRLTVPATEIRLRFQNGSAQPLGAVTMIPDPLSGGTTVIDVPF